VLRGLHTLTDDRDSMAPGRSDLDMMEWEGGQTAYRYRRGELLTAKR